MTGNDLENLPGPAHVAIIMDGNGRWAEQHGLPRIEGHRRGVNVARDITGLAVGYGVKYLTLYAFSTENWKRSPAEVAGIFGIIGEILTQAIDFGRRNGIRFRALGKIDALPGGLQDAVHRAEAATLGLDRMQVNVCLNYGARHEILAAIRKLLERGVRADELNENLIKQFLYTADLPDPDLIIRTGGEQRLSNFLLWQAAYAELYFTDVLWPDFDDREIRLALAAYGLRQRRFGAVPQPSLSPHSM